MKTSKGIQKAEQGGEIRQRICNFCYTIFQVKFQFDSSGRTLEDKLYLRKFLNSRQGFWTFI